MAKLGDYIERVKEVIPYDKNIPVKGLSVDKCFIDTHITNLDKIKVPFQLVKKNQFAYVPVTSRNGDKLSLAFNSELDKIQISTTYIVFQITRQDLLNCFYLDLFFKRSLIDKIARYSSTGSVRESLSFGNLAWIPISVPSLDKQERIVKKYQTITRYVEIKRRINELFERQMIAYYHILFDNLTDYTIKNFGELFTIIRGGRPPRGNLEQEKKYFCKAGGIPWLQVRDISKKNYKFVSETSDQLTPEGFRRGRCTMLGGGHLLLINTSSKEQLGKVLITENIELTASPCFWALKTKKNLSSEYLPLTFVYFWLKTNIWKLTRITNNTNSVWAINKNRLLSFSFKLPTQTLINKFNNFCESIFELQKSNEQIIKRLVKLQKCWVESLD